MHTAFFARGAHLVGGAAAGAIDVAGGGDGGGDDGRDEGRLGDAADERRDARRGACEHTRRAATGSAAGGMRRIGPEFEPQGPQRTFCAAKKVAAATAHGAAAAAHPPPTQRPPLGRSHSMGTTEPDGPLSHDHAVSGMSARVAHSEGAHLLEVKVGIEHVLPTRCEAARAPHG